jgi:type II secretory pathway component PulC
MNAIDRTKIISVSAGENSILFLYTLLLSEITLWDAIPPQWSQSQSLFSSQNDLMLIKRRQIHRSPHPLR